MTEAYFTNYARGGAINNSGSQPGILNSAIPQRQLETLKLPSDDETGGVPPREHQRPHPGQDWLPPHTDPRSDQPHNSLPGGLPRSNEGIFQTLAYPSDDGGQIRPNFVF